MQPAALESYERALHAFRTYRGDPIAPLDEAIALDEGFAGAHVAKAAMFAANFERRFMGEALAALARGREAIERAGPRDRALARAVELVARGAWEAGVRAIDEILVDHPRDGLALQFGHLLDFYRGDALNLRNRVARVLPAWSEALPGYGCVLGMYAFGLEECNQYAEAERTGRRAVEISGDDSWGVHAVAHVMEMQGRAADGLAWYEQTRAVWAGDDNGFAFHNHWHTALFRMDGGDLAAALATFDERMASGGETVLTRIDATALLWRLMLEGADVAARFGVIADAWERTLPDEGGLYAFNDFHAALALAAAGRREALARLRKQVADSASQPGSNAAMAQAVGVGACEAAIAYCAGRFGEAAAQIGAVRDVSHRFGGSHAQRDLLSLTLIDAAWRAGQRGLARHVLAERLAQKPQGRWGLRLEQRIRGEALPRAA